MQSSSSLWPLERCSSGGKCASWIRALLFLQLVSALTFQLRPTEAWITNGITIIYTSVFILFLGWNLLSRHVFPFRVQDCSVSSVLSTGSQAVENTCDALAACASRCKAVVWVYMERSPAAVRDLYGRLKHSWSRWRRRRENDYAANETASELTQLLINDKMTLPPLQDALIAPELNVMERLEDANEPKQDKQTSPKLQDKKDW